MRAVILAAGRGSRLGAQTEDRPKCMVELAQRPLIARQVALKKTECCVSRLTKYLNALRKYRFKTDAKNRGGRS